MPEREAAAELASLGLPATATLERAVLTATTSDGAGPTPLAGVTPVAVEGVE